MLKLGKTYEEVFESFEWQVPELYNIGVDVCDKWADQRDRKALIYEDHQGRVTDYTFAQLKRLSNQLANGLRANGIHREHRIGILLGQCPETAITHIAAYKLGAVAIPLFTLFGTDALEYRLSNSSASALVTDGPNLSKVMEIRDRLPDLRLIAVISGETPPGVTDFWKLVEKGSDEFEPVATRADDPALIIYTSGTTGPPKGALHAHRVVLGHMPGVEFPHNFFPEQGDRFWTPADWAWIGGLIDVLFPSWHHGVTVVAHRARKFDPEEAFYLMAKHKIRNAFMPPTALKMMRQVQDPRSRHNYQMRSIGSGGETLGSELLDWGKETMGLMINEFYGQTEVNLVVGNCSKLMEIRPGSMGRPIPGHSVDVVDPEGHPVLPGIVGEVAIKRPDPVMFLEYWGNPQATSEKFVNDWGLTGDLAKKDPDGYLWYVGRKDDVITSAGYRIGPAEIEDCVLKHPAVSMVAVVGCPDKLRTEIVKAFIVLKPGITSGDELVREIQDFVRTRLAAHEFPREIEFLPELPMTATGKIIRKELRRLEVEKNQRLSNAALSSENKNMA
ncbi:MAG: acyl-CoA synthetase [Desulfomonile tiedjei]|uniref:Acyl-CoA synthetase n=1 Tax=Desulfomonile tiedjei TaxID=2358 RepID=A0A9D6V3L5_9BACT|nr:acyl-CoA synthetase [Desulfomonile tiedjei]